MDDNMSLLLGHVCQSSHYGERLCVIYIPKRFGYILCSKVCAYKMCIRVLLPGVALSLIFLACTFSRGGECWSCLLFRFMTKISTMFVSHTGGTDIVRVEGVQVIG